MRLMLIQLNLVSFVDDEIFSAFFRNNKLASSKKYVTYVSVLVCLCLRRLNPKLIYDRIVYRAFEMHQRRVCVS